MGLQTREFFLDHSEITDVVNAIKLELALLSQRSESGEPAIYGPNQSGYDSVYSLYGQMTDATGSRFLSQEFGKIVVNDKTKSAYMRVNKPNPSAGENTNYPLEEFIDEYSLNLAMQKIEDTYAVKK